MNRPCGSSTFDSTGSFSIKFTFRQNAISADWMEVFRLTDSILNGDDYTTNPASRILALFIIPGTNVLYWCMSTSVDYS